jgi:hypothetical protein
MSKVEVNQISSQCGSTLTIGQSGDTIQLACGATQTGFGRTGTVDWDTTPKTASFTAVSGNGYFVNTTSGEITMTMPSGSAGAIVSIQDYNKTFDTNNLVITPASGEKINGGQASGELIISTEGQGLTFVYVDSTVGWKTVHENEFTQGGSNFIAATGGTVTCCGDYKIHTFTGPGTFTVSNAGNPAGSTTVDYLVVAGGGGGGANRGGGGGGGGYRESCGGASGCYTTSPLANPCGALPVSVQGYPITVGGGAAPTTSGRGDAGSNSVFSTITSAGGAGGGSATSSPLGPGNNGASGGGAATPGTGGTGNTPPVSPPQGNNGGNGDVAGPYTAGGGGGATAVGTNGSPSTGGPGGAGATSSINATPTARAGGGGGATNGLPVGNGQDGGGNAGTPGNKGDDATANTGGGGGGGGGNSPTCTDNDGGAGGSGIVIIRYKYQ